MLPGRCAQRGPRGQDFAQLGLGRRVCGNCAGFRAAQISTPHFSRGIRFLFGSPRAAFVPHCQRRIVLVQALDSQGLVSFLEPRGGLTFSHFVKILKGMDDKPRWQGCTSYPQRSYGSFGNGGQRQKYRCGVGSGSRNTRLGNASPMFGQSTPTRPSWPLYRVQYRGEQVSPRCRDSLQSWKGLHPTRDDARRIRPRRLERGLLMATGTSRKIPTTATWRWSSAFRCVPSIRMRELERSGPLVDSLVDRRDLAAEEVRLSGSARRLDRTL